MGYGMPSISVSERMESARSAVNSAYTAVQGAIEAFVEDLGHVEDTHEALDAVAAILSLANYAIKEIEYEVASSRVGPF